MFARTIEQNPVRLVTHRNGLHNSTLLDVDHTETVAQAVRHICQRAIRVECDIVRLTADCVMPNSRAAADTDPARTIASKISNCLICMGRTTSGIALSIPYHVKSE